MHKLFLSFVIVTTLFLSGCSEKETNRLMVTDTSPAEAYQAVNDALTGVSHILIRSFIEDKEIVFESNQEPDISDEPVANLKKKLTGYKKGYFGMVTITQVGTSVDLNLLVDENDYQHLAIMISQDKEYLYNELKEYFGSRVYIVQ